MKMSRACSGILSSENDDFKFLKNCKNIKCMCIIGHHSSKGCVTVLSLQISLSVTRNTNVTVAKELHYIFSEISKL